MASKNNAVENFEEWRKNKASTEETASEFSGETVTSIEKPAAPQQGEPTVSALSVRFAKALDSLAALSKSGVARIKLAMAPKEKTEKSLSEPEKKKSNSKTDSAEKTSLTSKLKALPATARAKYSEASARNKKITLATVIAVPVIVIAVILVAKFEFVTPNVGIKTSAGPIPGASVLIEKGAAIAPNDLIVAVQPGSPEDAPELIIGTVFSSNEETYALYDGEVIWQIPVGDLKGKVLFAEATQKLP